MNQQHGGNVQIAATGTDNSGSVSAELTANRELVRVQIKSGWERSLSAESLGAAILSAYSDALSKLPELSVEDLLSGEASSSPDTNSRLLEFDGPPRSMESYSEAVRNTIDQAAAALSDLRMANKTASPPDSSAARTVAFRLNQNWIVGCKVNPEWAARKSAAELTAEIMNALGQAKSRQGEEDPSAVAQERVQQAVQSLMNLGYEAITRLASQRLGN
ncbi:Uncharacterised BCR, YbaB family COG0718 [Mycobacteroides abscessus subsp. massiliense]|uniref:YbaB/EbfC family nucleoid-associated protein n=1 Tax=Mycobacteroides abscessus TaxID=36809 RepID=UPI0009C65C7A|nr:YbaB/EbfC family nucleoid-associated protein [Mycobacteroides abscessus]SKD28916.1 Uncharacterised BCR, YbaB family COG0718 [Mycobacteroides abscessus subsp. massiliense]SKF38506.1 Uncharacterised BCR, YbaB family COG0718 [Mycobacteroides abscessus subsp. massiliense]SKK01456.1 Uncharacterised BCR, YbaB family COG0718 [Mycobacteroides abscessus subsp. massiliense]SKK75578.1 Uncharacterised BCR, YbaB family COG0718 [Mycobacteroides abscessus subsp. massiliense]SKM73373.1 Uncharacterised BCR,